jgi:sec-independent protein translocase protein TatA
MGNLGFTEIMIILVVVLLVFGAKRLPEIGSSMGKGIREFKRSLSDTADALGQPSEDRSAPSRQLDAPPPQNTSSTTGEPKRLSQ